MRIVFVGAGETAVRTVELLAKRGHEIVIIEKEKERVEEISEKLDCSFLHGDGGSPEVLRETGPGETDVLVCMTSTDRDNIIAGLVGRSLGFSRVIVSIRDAGYEPVCLELGLEDTIIPSRTTSRYLADMMEGRDPMELSTIIKGEARFFVFVVQKEDEGTLNDLDLPDDVRVVCVYRGEELLLPEEETKVKAEDEIVIITVADRLTELRDRFTPVGRKDAPQFGKKDRDEDEN